MIPPRKVKFEAAKRENENLRFRTFLKCNADAEELDQQFLDLHHELFASYDCSRCRNCCKMYHGTISTEEIGQAADHLQMSKETLIKMYLTINEVEDVYQTIHMPCDFLDEGGACMLADHRPDNCKKYPYTDQPDRLGSLYSVLEAVEVCPVAFEKWERLKKIYKFR